MIATWYFYTSYGVFGAYFIIFLTLLGKILYSDSNGERVPYIVSCNIVFLGTLGKFIELGFDWGGTCIDTLG